ncbi:MAG: NAD(P)-dependent oxidoreductase [Elusimicrobiota bacterium]|jgi:D-3-phosphoglycerate dehydrogenase
MTKHKRVILLAEPLSFSKEASRRIGKLGRLIQGPFTRRELLARIRNADILWVRLGHRIDRDVLAAAPRLRCIVSPTTGLDHIDQNECRRRGIPVLSLKGQSGFLRTVTGTAEHAIGLTLSLLRHSHASMEDVCAGHWRRSPFIGRQTSSLTLGLVGLGRLGKMMARLGRPLFGRLLGTDPRLRFNIPGLEWVSFQKVLKESDVVSIHVDANPSTHDLFGAKELGRMKKGAYFINTSRGSLINESVLLRSLQSGRLAGAALDVLANEHRPGFDPRREALVRYAASHSNLLITPHIGGATQESMEDTEIFMAQLLEDYLKSPGSRSS